jgi:hypothetical protein
MRRSLALGLAGLTAAAAAYALWPRPSSPEERVRAAVRQMEHGLESRDASAVLEHVSELFHSSTLGDRTDLRRLVLAQLLRGGGLRVVTLQADVLAEPDGRLRWVGRVAAARAGGAGLAAVTEGELQQFHVDAVFADEHGEWRVQEASVTPLQ